MPRFCYWVTEAEAAMKRQRGFIDNSIVFPILVLLGLIAYMGVTDNGWGDLPWWLYLLFVLVVGGSLALPSHSQFPNARFDDKEKDDVD